jgi:hypothetical protein
MHADSLQQECEEPKEPTGVESDDAEGGPEFDLVTGKYRYRRKFEMEPRKPAGLEAATGALSLRNNEFTLARLESAGSEWWRIERIGLTLRQLPCVKKLVWTGGSRGP